MISIHHNQKGFSLIEILIAITLLAVMMVGVISFSNNSSQTVDRVVKEDAELLQREMALNIFDWDFSNIYSPLYFSDAATMKLTGWERSGITMDDQGPKNAFVTNKRFPLASKDQLPVPLFTSPEKSTFEFFTSSNRRKVKNARQSIYAWVRYTLKPMKEEGNAPGLSSLVRYFDAHDPYNPDLDLETTKEYVLLNNVKSLEFKFWNPKSQKYSDTLSEVDGGKYDLAGIKVTLSVIDRNKNEIKVERTFRNSWPKQSTEESSSTTQPQGATSEQQ